MDRIPPKRLHPDMAIAAFYSNVRSVKMREKLSVHVVSTLEELSESADRCAAMKKVVTSNLSRWSKHELYVYPRWPCRSQE